MNAQSQLAELFEMMKQCPLGYEDFESAYKEDMDEPVQWGFLRMARNAYVQAAADPHKFGDAAGTIVEKIEALPVFQQTFGTEVGLAYSEPYVEIFQKIYATKWGVRPENFLIEDERRGFIVQFLPESNYNVWPVRR